MITKTAISASGAMKYIKDGLTLKPVRGWLKQRRATKDFANVIEEMKNLNKKFPNATKEELAAPFAPLGERMVEVLNRPGGVLANTIKPHKALGQVGAAYGLAGAGLGAGGAGLYALAKKLRNRGETE